MSLYPLLLDNVIKKYFIILVARNVYNDAIARTKLHHGHNTVLNFRLQNLKVKEPNPLYM